MIKWNQEEDFVVFFFGLFPSTQAHLLTSSEDFLLCYLPRAVRIYPNTKGSYMDELASSSPTCSPSCPSFLPSQFSRPSQMKTPNDSLSCNGKSNSCLFLQNPWTYPTWSQDSSAKLVFSSALWTPTFRPLLTLLLPTIPSRLHWAFCNG